METLVAVFPRLSKHAKVKDRILDGRANANVDFQDLRSLLTSLGFSERINSSHHIFTKEGIADIVNIQPKGGKGKPYQVRQIARIIKQNNL